MHALYEQKGLHPCDGTKQVDKQSRKFKNAQYNWMPKEKRSPIDIPQKDIKLELLNKIRFRDEINVARRWFLLEAEDKSCVASLKLTGDLTKARACRITECIYLMLEQRGYDINCKAIFAAASANTASAQEYIIFFPHFERYTTDDLELLFKLFQQSFVHADAQETVIDVAKNRIIPIKVPAVVKTFDYTSSPAVHADSIFLTLSEDLLNKHFKDQTLEYNRKCEVTPLAEGSWRDTIQGSLEEKNRSKEIYSTLEPTISPATLKSIYTRMLQECGIAFVPYEEVVTNVFLNVTFQALSTSGSHVIAYLFDPEIDFFNTCLDVLAESWIENPTILARYFKIINEDFYFCIQMDQTCFSKLSQDTALISLKNKGDLIFDPDQGAVYFKLFNYLESYQKAFKVAAKNKDINIIPLCLMKQFLHDAGNSDGIKLFFQKIIPTLMRKLFSVINRAMGSDIFSLKSREETQRYLTPIEINQKVKGNVDQLTAAIQLRTQQPLHVVGLTLKHQADFESEVKKIDINVATSAPGASLLSGEDKEDLQQFFSKELAKKDFKGAVSFQYETGLIKCILPKLWNAGAQEILSLIKILGDGFVQAQSKTNREGTTLQLKFSAGLDSVKFISAIKIYSNQSIPAPVAHASSNIAPNAVFMPLPSGSSNSTSSTRKVSEDSSVVAAPPAPS